MESDGFKEDSQNRRLVETIERLCGVPMGNGRSIEKTCEEFGASQGTIARYLRINTLHPGLQEKIDEGKIPLRAGVELSNEEMIEDALNQYYWHIRYLQNPETGLYYHGYDHIAGDHMSGFYWGRANAWAAFTMSQVGGILPKCYLYPKYMDVAGSLDEQLSAIKLLQTPDGLWRTILDDENSYEEVSASAGIAAAMVTRANPLHTRYINKAIRGLLANVSPDGRVLHVSGGTAVMNDADGYRNISRDWIQGWGQGLALAFFDRVLISDSLQGSAL